MLRATQDFTHEGVTVKKGETIHTCGEDVKLKPKQVIALMNAGMVEMTPFAGNLAAKKAAKEK